MTEKQDLLRLLNEVKVDMLGDKAHPFSLRQLCYYCNPRVNRKRYTDFEIPKKSGGKRRISAPVNGLKSILSCLNVIFQAMYEPSEYAMGFAVGKSVVDNAKMHVGKNYVFNTDLKDFFPSIHQARVWKRLQLPPFNFNQNIANVMAGLCCMKVSSPDGDNYVLPQGAPTSPVITNMICDNLDRRLNGLANRFGLTYTRYADDITFSSMHNVYQEDGDFVKELHRIIEDQNFTINESKTRLQRKGSRQEVTGLTVCNAPNVTKKYVHNIRSLLAIWEHHGYDIAYRRFLPKYTSEKGYIKKGTPNLDSVLAGKLLYLKMVKGEDNPLYTRLQCRFDKLIGIMNGEMTSDTELRFLYTMGAKEFDFSHSKGKLEKGQDGFYYVENGARIPFRTSKQLSQDDLNNDNIQISYCDNGKSRFYLVHKPFLQKQPANNSQNDVLDKKLTALCDSGFDLNVL